MPTASAGHWPPRACQRFIPDDLLQNGGVAGIELTALGLHTAHGERIGVAVGVDAELAGHTVEILGGKDRVEDRGAIFLANLVDRVQRNIGRLITIHRVDLGLTIELGLVAIIPFFALAGHLRAWYAAEREIGALSRIAGGLQEGVLVDAIRAHELAGEAGRAQILQQQAGVVLGDAAKVDHVGVGILDLGAKRLIVLGLLVDALVALLLDTVRLGDGAEHIRDALAVGLSVVQDVHALDPQSLGPVRGRRALQVVGRHHAGVVALASWVVLVGLAGLALAGLGQAGVGVGRADHHKSGLVEDRDRDLGR